MNKSGCLAEMVYATNSKFVLNKQDVGSSPTAANINKATFMSKSLLQLNLCRKNLSLGGFLA